MSYNAFDDTTDGNKKGPKRPFWTLDFDDEDALLRWLVEDYDHLKEQAQMRIETQRKNLASYRGIQYQTQDIKNREIEADLGPKESKGASKKVVINQMVGMVEQDVARLTKYRGAVACTPPSDEYDDRVVAEIADDLIEAKWEKEEIDFVYQKLHRRKKIFGEDFLGVFWNPDLGHYHPDYVAEVFKRAGIKENPAKMSKGEIREIFRTQIKEIPRLPLIDPKTGEQLVADGNPLWIDKPVRVGDIEYKPIFSWNMYMQRKPSYDLSEYGMFEECMHVDDVKADHPEKADKITADKDLSWFDPEAFEDQVREDHTNVIHFYHRSTKRLGQGRYVKFTRSAILVNKPNPYQGPDGVIFPWERIADIDTPAIQNGESYVTHGRPAQAIYNLIASLRLRNQFLFAHPKWFAQKGAIKSESLGNKSTVVWMEPGTPPPSLAQPNLGSSEQSNLRKESREDLQQVMGSYAISNGEVPPGITAASALMLLDEQENDRAAPGVASHTRHQRAVALRTLWLMADNYEETDGRLEELLGKSKASEIETFKMSDLTRIGDLRIQNMSALPQQRSAKVQYMIDIKKNFPGVIADDQVADALDLGQVQKFKNIISVSIRKAESEDDSMFRTGKAPEPEKWENHIIHYRQHLKTMNEPSFATLPDRIKAGFEDHMLATEMLMFDVAQRNPLYLQAIMQQFPSYPIFFTPPQMPQEPQLPAPGPGAGAPPMGSEAVPPPDMPPPNVPAPPTGAPELPPGAEDITPMPEGALPGAGLETQLGA